MNFSLSHPQLGTAKVQLVPSPLFQKCKYHLNTPSEVVSLLGNELRKQDREHFLVIYLTNRNQVIDIEIVAIGTLEDLVISPREVFKGAILASAAAIILVHNHPSGISQPSHADKQITHKLIQAGHICGIPIRDHIIIGEDYFSFHENGLLSTLRSMPLS